MITANLQHMICSVFHQKDRKKQTYRILILLGRPVLHVAKHMCNFHFVEIHDLFDILVNRVVGVRPVRVGPTEQIRVNVFQVAQQQGVREEITFFCRT
jgi:hypothetical protein